MSDFLIHLELPSEKHRDSFLDAMKEDEAEGVPIPEGLFTKAGFVAELARLSAYTKREEVPPGYVPSTEYWIVDADGYAGRLSIRHELTESLRHFGGHIGYRVRPTKRRRGYATQALALALPEAQKLGIDEVFITCDYDNIASRKVIEKNGGQLEAEGQAICRYWVKTKARVLPEVAENFRISGIAVGITTSGEVWCENRLVGKVGREQRFDQWFWRAYDPNPEIEIKRFFTSRPEAIQLLLLRADLIEGIGF